VHREGRIDEVTAQRTQPRQRALLVGTGQPAESDYIRCQDCGEFSPLGHDSDLPTPIYHGVERSVDGAGHMSRRIGIIEFDHPELITVNVHRLEHRFGRPVEGDPGTTDHGPIAVVQPSVARWRSLCLTPSLGF